MIYWYPYLRKPTTKDYIGKSAMNGEFHGNTVNGEFHRNLSLFIYGMSNHITIDGIIQPNDED